MNAHDIQPDESTEIEEMRAWLADCFEDESGAIEELTPAQVRRQVEYHYEGGVAAFRRDA